MDFFLQVIAGTFVFSLGLFQLVLPLAFHFFLGKTGSQGDSTTLDREKLYINEVRLPQIFVFWNLFFFFGEKSKIFKDGMRTEDHFELHLKTPDVVVESNPWVSMSSHFNVVFFIVEL